MKGDKQVLLLIGSPRGFKSSSASLGTYLLNRLKKRRFYADTLHIHSLLGSEEKLEKLIAAIDASDLVIIAAPLYIDSIPAPTIEVMEFIYNRRRATGPTKKQHLVALVNSGFPEPAQNATALAIYQQFAKEAGFIWAGGLAFASGEIAIEGKPVDKIGFMGRNVRKSLNIAAIALSDTKSIPEEARSLSAKPLVPVWLFHFLGNNYYWRPRVPDKKVWKAINDRPYQNTK
jgi:multimeric flavodoxin WrbA